MDIILRRCANQKRHHSWLIVELPFWRKTHHWATLKFMSTNLRRQIAMLLVWVFALTTSAAAFSACRHGDASSDTAPILAMHTGHGAHQPGLDQMDTAPGIGAGCDCGCTCAGSCNHVCHTSILLLQVAQTMELTHVALPTGSRAFTLRPSTHPSLRPPTALL